MQGSDLAVRAECDIGNGRAAVTSRSFSPQSLQSEREFLVRQGNTCAAAKAAADGAVVVRARRAPGDLRGAVRIGHDDLVREDTISEDASDSEDLIVSPARLESDLR